MSKMKDAINKTLKQIFLKVVYKFPILLSLLFFVAGSLFFLYFPYLAKGVKVDVGALSPLHATTTYSAKQFKLCAKNFETLLQFKSNATQLNYLVSFLSDLDVETYSMDESLEITDSLEPSLVYGLYKPPKAYSLQSTLLVCNLNNNEYGCSIILSIVDLLIKQNILNNNLVVLFINKENDNFEILEKFVDKTYKGSFEKHIKRFEDPHHAISIDVGNEPFGTLDLEFVGPDGKMTNMDYLAISKEISRYNDINLKLAFSPRVDCDDYECKLKTMTNQLIKMAFMRGESNSLNALYKHNIHSINLKAKRSTKKSTSETPNVGILVEAIIRSMNNLNAPLRDVSYNHYLMLNLRQCVDFGMFIVLSIILALCPAIYCFSRTIHHKEKNTNDFYFNYTPAAISFVAVVNFLVVSFILYRAIEVYNLTKILEDHKILMDQFKVHFFTNAVFVLIITQFTFVFTSITHENLEHAIILFMSIASIGASFVNIGTSLLLFTAGFLLYAMHILGAKISPVLKIIILTTLSPLSICIFLEKYFNIAAFDFFAKEINAKTLSSFLAMQIVLPMYSLFFGCSINALAGRSSPK